MADDDRRTGDKVDKRSQAVSTAECPQPEYRPGYPAEYQTFTPKAPSARRQ